MLLHFWPILGERFEGDVELYFLNYLHLFVMWNPFNFQMDLGPLGCSDEGDGKSWDYLGFAHQSFPPCPLSAPRA